MGTTIESLLTHREWVHRVARALVSSETEAEEIEQEAWVRAIDRPPATEGKAKAWFRTVLRRVARDRWRTASRRDAREARIEPPSPSAPTADLVAEAEAHRLVVNAALALPEPYREAIVLRYFHELPAAEIAERLDIPLETVRTRVKRAIGRLRGELDGRHGGDRRAWTAVVALLLPATAKAGVGVKAGLALAAAAAILGTVLIWPRGEEASPAPETPAPVVAAVPEIVEEALILAEIPPDPAPPPLTEFVDEGDHANLVAPSPPPEPSLVVTVVDHRGRPLAGSKVVVHPRRSRDRYLREMHWSGRPAPLPSILTKSTDDAGVIVIPELAPASYLLTAAADGFVPAQAIHIVGASGRAPPCRFVLCPATTLSGTVRRRNGGVLSGVTVACGSARTVADERGRYEITGVPAERAALSVVLGSGTTVTTGLIDTRQVREYDIVLDLGASAAGRVVDDRTGRGVAGANVRVHVSDPFQRRAGGFAATVTGEDGRYSFDKLPEGRVSGLFVRADGYVPADLAWPDGCETLRRRRTWRRDVRLVRGATVTGSVHYLTGEPAPGAIVRLHGDGWDAESERRTDRRGRYRIENVPAGLARVYARGPGFWVPGSHGSWRLETLPDDLRLVVPEEGEVAKTMFVARGAVVEGVVLRRDGTLHAGVEVYCRPGGSTHTPTDAEGRFRLEGIPAGETVRIHACSVANQYGSSEPFAVSGTETVRGVVVRMDALIVVAGRVEGPPPGVTLRICGAWDERSSESAESARVHSRIVPVAKDGTFRVEGLRAGAWNLLASAEECGETAVQLGELAGGECRNDVVIRLEAEQRISGRLVRSDDGPVAGTPIHVLPWPERWGLVHSSLGTVRAFAGETGRFEIRGLGAGKYRVAADLPGWIDASRVVDAGTEGLVLEARPALRITGVLLDADTRKPAAGVPVTAHPQIRLTHRPDVTVRTVSGPDGRFVLEPLYDIGYGVTTGVRNEWRRGECEYLQQTRTLRAGKTNLRIWIVPGKAIEGRVLGGDRKPLAGISVSSRRGGSGARTDADGVFRLARLQPGKHDLRFVDLSRRGLIEAWKKRVPAGTRDVMLVMKAGPSISGRITDPDGGAPAGRGHLKVVPRQAHKGQVVRIAADGTFTTPALVAGRTYDLIASDFDDTIGVRVADVTAGTEGVRIVLRRGRTISGRVLDEAGDPVSAGIRVAAYANGLTKTRDPDGRYPSTSTRADGTFEMRGVGDDDFRIRAGGGPNGYLPVRTDAAESVRPGVRDLSPARATRRADFRPARGPRRSRCRGFGPLDPEAGADHREVRHENGRGRVLPDSTPRRRPRPLHGPCRHEEDRRRHLRRPGRRCGDHDRVIPQHMVEESLSAPLTCI